MNKKNLLIIPTSYPDVDNRHLGGIFIKEHLIYLKNYFKNVYVIVPTAYIPSFLTKYKIFRKYAYLTFSSDYIYDNIHVKYIKYPTLPFNFLRRYADKFALPFIYLYLKTRKIKYDIIFAHFTFPSGGIARMLSKINNIKYLLTVHEGSRLYNPEIDEKSNRFLKIWFDAAFVIRVSDNDINKLIERGIPSDRVKYLPNGFDPEKFYLPSEDEIIELREKLKLPLDKKIILSVGTLVKVKGQENLIDAINRLRENHSNFICIIIGEGYLKEKLQEKINRLNMADYVKLVGWVNHDDISFWYRASDIFVSSSLAEGNPTVMFEALGTGLPFIGSDVGGISKIVVNEDLGILVMPKNVEELHNALEISLSKQWDREYIYSYAKQFTWEKIAKDTANLIYRI
jgi:glycosyltransferase involved in cell wall biosynthesis